MKPFTGVHFYRHGEKPAEGKEDTLAIVQVGRGPAHYVVQVGTTYKHETTFEVRLLSRLVLGSWMWALVATILYTPSSSSCTGDYFLLRTQHPNNTNLHSRVRQDRAGLLGRVNLGLSGLNLLWVLD